MFRVIPDPMVVRRGVESCRTLRLQTQQGFSWQGIVQSEGDEVRGAFVLYMRKVSTGVSTCSKWIDRFMFF